MGDDNYEEEGDRRKGFILCTVCGINVLIALTRDSHGHNARCDPWFA